MEILEKIKELIWESSNPLFFYDDDPDGLVSYLLLRKHFKKGEGVIIRVRSGSNDEEENLYLNKIEKYTPDLVVFLDKPTLTQEIFDNIHVKKIWIDHHEHVDVKGVTYYNSRILDKENKPASYICYKITQEDLWLAAVGVTSDWNNSLIKDFKKEYPDLVKGAKNLKPETILYNTELGKLARIFSFTLKGKTGDINKLIKLMLQINDPYEILEKRTSEGKALFENAEKMKKKYENLLERALKENKKGKLFVFKYGNEKISFTAELANELIYRFPKKIIIVGRVKDDEMKISLRSTKAKLPSILKKVLGEVNGKGGGHEHACAALIKEEDFEKFVKLIKENVES